MRPAGVLRDVPIVVVVIGQFHEFLVLAVLLVRVVCYSGFRVRLDYMVVRLLR